MRLQDTRLGDTVSERSDKIGKVISRIAEIDMDLNDQSFDVLGTAYMILIGLFQSDAGKKGGEFFTPVGPSTLCATLATVGLDEAKTVGDCTCGSASMLLDVKKHLTTGRVGHFYGQENNPTTYNLDAVIGLPANLFHGTQIPVCILVLKSNYVYKEIIPKNNILVENRQFVYFEKYDYKFHWNREDSVIEIYIPIK